MTRDEAYLILTKYLKNKNLLKHSLAAEAAMKGIYRHLYQGAAYNPDSENSWGITGLLHDADYEMCQGKPEKHGILLIEKEGEKIPPDIAYAIKAHNYEHTLVLPKSLLDWSIATVDQLTGLIVAAALIHPDKKLASLDVNFILNRFQSKSFAKGADRSSITKCEEKLNIPLQQFIEITLRSMQEISNDLEL